jgi:DNA-binding transcriptional MerR regulator
MGKAETEIFDRLIGETAREARVEPGTVRTYADLGLIQYRRLTNGTRVFTASAPAQVREILLKRLANKGRRPA